MNHHEEQDLSEIEALIYRLFAEKQFAMALLALVMVANLMCAQFLLLRIAAPTGQAIGAPDPTARADLRCLDGRLFGMNGAAPSWSELAGKKVVLHLDTHSSACLLEAADRDIEEVVVGIPITGASP